MHGLTPTITRPPSLIAYAGSPPDAAIRARRETPWAAHRHIGGGAKALGWRKAHWRGRPVKAGQHSPLVRSRELDVTCLDARHASAALKMQMNKTDQNDAEKLAQIMLNRPGFVGGWFS
jgi:hypothetical protein